MSDAPFFILGAHGSGSTLLRLMLDSHERLAVPPETGVMRLVTAHRWVPFWELGADWHGRLGIDADDLDRRLSHLYGGMFAEHAARQGKARWGEKTPFHVWHVDDIRRLFPDAVFVVIVRHPLGSIASAVRRFDRNLDRALRHWLGTTREVLRQTSSYGAAMCFVRYEDLIREPEPVLRELLEWLDEPWSAAVLAHHEVQRARSAARVAEGGTRTTDAVDAGRVERWRRWFDDEARAAVLAATRPWAGLLGYDDDPADPPRQITPAAGRRRFVATGEELAGLMAGTPGLDRSPPPRPRADDPILPRGKRRRRTALRRAGRARPEATRQLFDRLPEGVQESIRAARQARRRRRRR